MKYFVLKVVLYRWDEYEIIDAYCKHIGNFDVLIWFHNFYEFLFTTECI